MDIFVAGNLKSSAFAVVTNLLEGGHSVVVSNPPGLFSKIDHKEFTAYQMTSDDTLFKEIFRSYSFDLVFFFAESEDGSVALETSTDSQPNESLGQILAFSAHSHVHQFVYFSSIKVYGDVGAAREDATPKPTTSEGQKHLNSESLCRFYGTSQNMQVSIVRIPDIYGPNVQASFLHQLISTSKAKQKVEINNNAFSHCGFLHIDDLNSFIKYLIEDTDGHGQRTFNLNSEDINFAFLAEQLKYHFPRVEYLFNDEIPAESSIKKIEVKAAREHYKWTPSHKIISDLPQLIAETTLKSESKRSFPEKLRAFARAYRPFLVWGEVIFGAFLMHMMTVWTNTIIEFKYIDYRLLYAVIIGSTHGLLFGVLASLLAAASGAITWSRVGLDWALLAYNVENWIPFAVFFLAGAVTGYLHDKKENEINFERHQTALIHEKYEFLYSLYNEISSIKDRLREQLVGYRDSFGRFFRIATELNELEEDTIFFKALDTLEDLMKNDQIAIYSIEPTGNYGRLEVKSKAIIRPIPKSLKLSDFSQALETLQEGNLFQNKDLLPNYPSYIAPIMNGKILIGLVIIWEATFKQFSMYYFNLFRVITGMIQSSLVRAATFKNAQLEKLYLPSTQIMKPDAFQQSLEIRKKMRRKKVADFQLLRVEREGRTWQSLYEQLSRGIRGDDIAGITSENDTYCYVILSNASFENIGIVIDRLSNFNIQCAYVQGVESA